MPRPCLVGKPCFTAYEGFRAVTKSGTETWGLGLGDVGLGEVNKPDFCAEFVKYNFRWSREKSNMLESLSVVADDFQRPWFGWICLLACLTVRTLGTE